MEIYVGVASTMDNMIPECFGGEGELMFMRYELDTEDGSVYSRQTVRCTAENFADHAEENGVKEFVYDKMPAEMEEAIKAKGIGLHAGKTGKTVDAAKSII